LAVVFKKQEISQQVVTRMQDLASEFSKIFWGWYPRTLTAGGGDPLPHPTPSPTFVGTQTLVPLNCSAVVAPLLDVCLIAVGQGSYAVVDENGHPFMFRITAAFRLVE